MPGLTQLVDISADVLPYLDMSNMPSDGGTKLQGIIDGCTSVIEDMVGHCIAVTYADEIHDGGDTTIYLRRTPVLSIDSIVEVIGLVPYTLTEQPVGYPVDNFGFTLDNAKTGRVTRRSAGSQPFEFYDNIGNISVTYTAGRETLEPNIRLAALELIKHVYQFGQQSFGASSAYVPGVAEADEDEMVASPSGYLVPNRVAELCQPTRRLPGIA